MSRPVRPNRAQFRHFTQISTRWSDNDIYGHTNNSVYYFWFDTAVNEYLIRAGALDIHGGAVIGLVVETGCAYAAVLVHPGRTFGDRAIVDQLLRGFLGDQWIVLELAFQHLAIG